MVLMNHELFGVSQAKCMRRLHVVCMLRVCMLRVCMFALDGLFTSSRIHFSANATAIVRFERFENKIWQFWTGQHFSWENPRDTIRFISRRINF
jgi:hypothetical protein